MDTNFSKIDRIDQFIVNKSDIGNVLNDKFISKISDDFETKANIQYKKLLRKFTNQNNGQIIKQFREQLKDGDDNQYGDLGPMGGALGGQGDLIQFETEMQFGTYLSQQPIKSRWWNPFSWGGFTRDELLRSHLEAWEDEVFLAEYNRNLQMATAEDALNFVNEFQDNQESQWME